MSIPLFLPLPQYQPLPHVAGAISVRALCGLAGVECKATGAWTERHVKIITADGAVPALVAAPGDWGLVKITLPTDERVRVARYALAIMAYALHDPVCRQSIAHAEWAAIAAPRGRPRLPKAASNAERQQRFRKRLETT